MVNTTNYALEKYEAGNSANLLDQYNAQTLGTTLNHILNRTGTEIFTVTDLGTLKKTAEGYPIPPTE